MKPEVKRTRAPVRLAAGFGVAMAMLGGLAPLTEASPRLSSAAALAAPQAPQAIPDAETQTTAEPLTVRLNILTPGSVTFTDKQRQVVLAGTITNNSTQTYRDINTAAFVSSQPIVTPQALADAADSSPTAYVGERITGPGTFAGRGQLAPKQTKRFRLAFPISELRLNSPGVYWIGIHALATDDAGVRKTSGRVRTFLPALPDRVTSSATTSMIVPLTGQVYRDREGRVKNPTALAQAVSKNGRLGRVLEFGNRAAGSGSLVTWMVDPALLDAVEDVARGNRPLSLRGDVPGAGQSPSATDPADKGHPEDFWPGRNPNPVDGTGQRMAREWLSGIQRLLRDRTVLVLPYGNPDVSAVTRKRPWLLNRARALSQTWSKAQSFGVVPVISPPGGFLRPKALSDLERNELVLLTDHGRQLPTSTWKTTSGQPLVFASTAVGSGGAAPTPRLDPLSLRQRIYSDAALRANSDRPTPLVVALPTDWDPGVGVFQENLQGPWDSSWLYAATADSLTSADAPVFRESLPYSKGARDAELSEKDLRTVSDLGANARTMHSLLTPGNNAGPLLTGAALNGASYYARANRAFARDTTAELVNSTKTQMNKVTVTGRELVTLSGLEGTLTVSIVNDLPVPVRANIRVTGAGDQVMVSTTKVSTVAAKARTTLRLKANARAVGVHRITAQPETPDGRPFGEPFSFTLRTSDVGRWIWAVLFVAGAVLAVAVARQITDRVRRGRLRPANEDAPSEVAENLAAYDEAPPGETDKAVEATPASDDRDRR